MSPYLACVVLTWVISTLARMHMHRKAHARVGMLVPPPPTHHLQMHVMQNHVEPPPFYVNSGCTNRHKCIWYTLHCMKCTQSVQSACHSLCACRWGEGCLFLAAVMLVDGLLLAVVLPCPLCGKNTTCNSLSAASLLIGEYLHPATPRCGVFRA